VTGSGFEAVLVSLAGEVDVERSGGIGDPLDPGRVTRYSDQTNHYHEGAPDERQSRDQGPATRPG